MRVSASVMRASLMTPLLYASSMVLKSSSGSLKNRNISHPALMDAGSISRRVMRSVMPTIWEASVTTMPLKPSLPRSSVVMISGLSVAGIMSSSFSAGLMARAYSGSMICPPMMASRPPSICVLYTIP